MWRDRGSPAGGRHGDDAVGTWAIVARVRRRLLVARLVEGLGGGLAVAGVVGVLSSSIAAGFWWRVVAIAAGLATSAAWLLSDVRLRRQPALVDWIDTATLLRNQLVTLGELTSGQVSAPTYVRHRLARTAHASVSAIDVARLVPVTRGAGVALLGGLVVALWASGMPGSGQRPAEVDSAPAFASSAVEAAVAALGEIRFTVVPPAYAGLERVELVDPERVSALAGSRIALEVTAAHGAVTLATHRTAPIGLDQTATGRFRGEVEAAETGYLVIGLEPTGRAGSSGTLRRLIGLHVDNDRSPVVRLTAPGRDLLLADADRRVELVVEATDDFGLDELRITYTIASGSGETFDFTEGDLPLSIARRSGRQWRARGALDLVALGVRPGDTIVYRAIAADRRQGPARFGTSETFVVEIAQERLAAAADFELPDDLARFALSQQMVLLKTERLHARRRSLARAALLEQSMAIAAEQRMVRAEFVFMMGGDVEDEEEEAAHSHEIQEGRLENQGRRELVRAIQHMSESERALNAAATAEALPAQRAAIEMLQRAFGRSRYILRTLPTRARIDPSRRLTGELDGVRPRIGRGAPTEARATNARVVETLARLVSLGDRLGGEGATERWRGDLAEVAQAVLALDPASEALAGVSRRLLAVAQDAGSGLEETREALANAAVAVGARRTGPPSPVRPRGPIAGALADALRQGGGTR